MVSIIEFEGATNAALSAALSFLSIQSAIIRTQQAVAESERVVLTASAPVQTVVKALKKSGFGRTLRLAFDKGIPILACGSAAQALVSSSEEGHSQCLELFSGTSQRLRSSASVPRLIHAGWNSITVEKKHPLLADIQPSDEFYFAHCSHILPMESSMVYACSEYGISMAAVIATKNLFATQFHPELSGQAGLRLLKNFSLWKGTI
ncbi:MAG: imidazole glycerol phosphate synthase subunit HisH [Chitinivibrionales bacterium]|nr:imidazole glycerol phosphate synthase subunit HisH [Chitinivibrionales bacterium]